MKNQREKNADEAKKISRAIWKDLQIKEVIRKYGYDAVKRAISKWLAIEREQASLNKEKEALEKRIKEINDKI